MGSDPRDSSLTPTDVKSVAVPGRRGEVASDAKITARIARPASDDTPPPLPPSPAAESAARWLARTQTGLPDVTPPPPPPPEPPPPPPEAAPPWVVPALLAVTMLVVGIIIGALLFGHRGKSCPATPAAPTAPAAPR